MELYLSGQPSRGEGCRADGIPAKGALTKQGLSQTWKSPEGGDQGQPSRSFLSRTTLGQTPLLLSAHLTLQLTLSLLLFL